MLVGYTRVSTLEQDVNPQIDELKRIGCERILCDKAGGAKADRPGLDTALAFLRNGDSWVA